MLIRHSLAYLVARGVPGIVSFLTIAFYTRLLSADEYGRYVVVIASVELADTVLFHWLRLALLRFLPGAGAQFERFLSLILGLFVISLAVSGVAGLALYVLWPDSSWRPLIAVGAVLLWAKALFELTLEYYRARMSPSTYGLLSVVRASLTLVLGLALLRAGLRVYGPLLGLLVALAACGGWGLVTVFQNIRPQLGRDVLPLVAYGVPMALSLVLNLVVALSDRFLLVGFLGATSAGVYAASYDLANQILTLLFVIINLAAYPLIVSTLATQGREAAAQQLQLNFLLLLAVGLPVALGVAVLAPDLSTLVLGPEFREAGRELLGVIAFAGLAAGLKAYYFDLAFQLGQQTLPQLWVLLAAAAANVLLNIWWIPRYGLLGAAWATVTAYGLGLAASAYWGRMVFPVPLPWREALGLLAAAVAMAAGLLLLPGMEGTDDGVTLLKKLLLGGIVYGAGVLVTNPMGLRRACIAWLRRRVQWQS